MTRSTHPVSRRRALAMGAAAGLMFSLGSGHAQAPATSAMVAFDGVYIPALFQTGSAGQSPEAAARAQVEQHYAAARATWRHVETSAWDAQALALSPARSAQFQAALAEEGAALQQLDQALRSGPPAAVLKAAGAIKGPFVRAYTALGWPANENPIGLPA